MPDPNVEKLLIGSLLVGVSILSGNTVLMSVAGGIGVNWSSEGLGGLWQSVRGGPPRGAELMHVYQQAIEDAANLLQRQFEHQHGRQHDQRAFELLRQTARSVAQAQYSAQVGSLDAAQRSLAQGIDDLLFGHDERQVAWIKARLLETTAAAFQQRLGENQIAWQHFHGWLIQQTAQHTAALSQSLSRVPDVLARLDDPSRFKQALDQSLAPLQAQLRELHAALRRRDSQPSPSHPSSIVFNNTGMQAGSVQQIAGNQYNQSAHAQGPGSSAFVFNGPSSIPRTEFTPIRPRTASILAVLANAEDVEQLALRQELRTLQACLAPYAERFTLHPLPASTIDDLCAALLRHKPRLLHFAGHGTAAGLLFERGDGRSRLVAYSALMAELEAYAPPLECVIFNACQSIAAVESYSGALFVVAMRGPINDDAAAEFTRGFYEALAAGHAIPFAYERGCNRIRLKGLSDADVPTLVRPQS